MTSLAPVLQAFFTDRLQTQRGASPHTVAAYRDTFRLLLNFAWQRTGRQPAQLDLGDLDVTLIIAFLQHLENDRGNKPATRNARLAAVHSLFRYAAFRCPEIAGTIQQVLAIDGKNTTRTEVCFLTGPEAQALLGAPDRNRRIGRRDHALLQLVTQTGLRVSEVTALTCADIHLGAGPHVRCTGKGRKQRCVPLAPATVAALRDYLEEYRGLPHEPFFPSPRGQHLSRDAIAQIVARHARTAACSCDTLHAKNVTPHTLRHTAAMALLHAGVDIAVIALWLGHESIQTTQAYLHADMTLKQRALARTTPPDAPPGCYRAPDDLLAFLDAL